MPQAVDHDANALRILTMQTLSKKNVEKEQTKFNVSRAIAKVLNQRTRHYQRAITLFELQVAILACNGPGQSAAQNGGLVIRVDREIMRSATVLATLQFLQYIAGRMDPDGASKLEHTKQLLGNRDAVELIGDMVFGGSGLSRVRHALTPREFVSKINQKMQEARCVNALTDFSLRFEVTPHRNTRKTGGITHAREILFEDLTGEGTLASDVYCLDYKTDSAKKLHCH